MGPRSRRRRCRARRLERLRLARGDTSSSTGSRRSRTRSTSTVVRFPLTGLEQPVRATPPGASGRSFREKLQRSAVERRQLRGARRGGLRRRAARAGAREGAARRRRGGRERGAAAPPSRSSARWETARGSARAPRSSRWSRRGSRRPAARRCSPRSSATAPPSRRPSARPRCSTPRPRPSSARSPTPSRTPPALRAGDVDLAVSPESRASRAFRARRSSWACRARSAEASPSSHPKLAVGETLGAGGALGLATAVTLLAPGATAPALLRVRGTLRTPPRTAVVTNVGYYGNASAVVLRAPTAVTPGEGEGKQEVQKIRRGELGGAAARLSRGPSGHENQVSYGL